MAEEAVVAEPEPLTPEAQAQAQAQARRVQAINTRFDRLAGANAIASRRAERRQQEFARQTAWDRAENLSHQRQVEQRHQQHAQERQQHREAAAWREARELLL